MTMRRVVNHDNGNGNGHNEESSNLLLTIGAKS